MNPRAALMLSVAGALAALVAGRALAGEAPAAGNVASPRVVEVAFAAADRALWGDGHWFSIPEYRDLGRVPTDGVALRANFKKRASTWEPGLLMAARALKNGRDEVKVKAIVNNRSGNGDKTITVLLEALNGGAVVQTATIAIDAEENGNDVGRSATMVFAPGTLRNAPPTRLRLTLTVEDD